MHDRSPKSKEAPGLSYNDWLASLQHHKFFGVTVDLSRLYQNVFQELLMISVLATVSGLVDFAYFTLLRKEDETVPLGFPFVVIFFVVFIKFFIEKTALTEFCTYLGLTYMGSSSLRRISIKLIALAFLAMFKYAVGPAIDVRKLQLERENHIYESGLAWVVTLWNIQNVWGYVIGLMLDHVGMITFLRTYIDCGVYSYKLITYNEKEEVGEEEEEMAEAKKEESKRFSRELNNNNNSYVKFKSSRFEVPNQAS